MKKLALRVALAVTAGSAVATEWKTVRIGVDASYPPFGSKTTGAEPQGLPAGCGIQST